MSSKKKSASSVQVSDAHEKSTDKLSVKEFRDRFWHSKWRTIQCGAPVPPAGIAHGIPLFYRDSTRLHSSQHHRVLMGCSIINMLYNLDLTMLEVFFVYSLKKAKTDIFSLSAHLPSLQLVTELPDSTKRGAKGRVTVQGAWVGSRHPARPFSPNYSFKIPGAEKRGHLVDWVEKASFGCLSKLFEIDAKERRCKTLLTARNLMAVVREPQEYVINILPRKMPKEVVPGEHYIVKDLPIYQASKEADAEKRRALLEIGRRRKTKGPFGRLPDRNATQTLLQRKLQQKGGSW
ncbi:hypothetical protein CK203_057401 [Vitis vinifera]|uniref:Uncharacterized protein n=1 Tax=Vitis vinifera TaxID=29760 RepID=A0A438FUG7_VITVI|nr:hypothetical protein CK203_057401 [Vitis vinifera]